VRLSWDFLAPLRNILDVPELKLHFKSGGDPMEPAHKSNS
jgi:hypothetical protein